MNTIRNLPSTIDVRRLIKRLECEVEEIENDLDSDNHWYSVDRAMAMRDILDKFIANDPMASVDGLDDEGESALAWPDQL